MSQQGTGGAGNPLMSNPMTGAQPLAGVGGGIRPPVPMSLQPPQAVNLMPSSMTPGNLNHNLPNVSMGAPQQRPMAPPPAGGMTPAQQVAGLGGQNAQGAMQAAMQGSPYAPNVQPPSLASGQGMSMSDITQLLKLLG